MKIAVFILMVIAPVVWLVFMLAYPVIERRITKAREAKAAQAEEQTQEAAIADLIVALLEGDGDWRDDGYRLALHSPFVSVWYSNKAFGLGVCLDEAVGEAWPNSDKRSLSLSKRQREKIWKAVDARKRGVARKRSAELMTAFAEAALAAARPNNPQTEEAADARAQ